MFVIAAAGCGAAGAWRISVPYVQPDAAFSVAWTAKMIFAVLIGGIGTIEGPILGTIVFLALQQWLANYGTWYFIVLGCLAIGIAIWAPRGIWGYISARLNIRLFPVGYGLWPPGERPARRAGRPARLRPRAASDATAAGAPRAGASRAAAARAIQAGLHGQPRPAQLTAGGISAAPRTRRGG